MDLQHDVTAITSSFIAHQGQPVAQQGIPCLIYLYLWCYDVSLPVETTLNESAVKRIKNQNQLYL